MNRAERRRAQRANGYRRASSKTGRRAPIRAARTDDQLTTLAAKGFVVAKPHLALPGEGKR